MTQLQLGGAKLFGLLPALLLSLAAAGAPGPAAAGPAAPPPVATLRPVTDRYGAATLVDAYRWLETPSDETARYLKDQNDYANRTLSRLRGREKLLQSIAGLGAPQPEISQMAQDGAALFYLSRPPGAAVSRLMLLPAEAGAPITLADPAAVPGQAIGGFAASQDGGFVAYTLAPQGAAPDAPATLHIIDAGRHAALDEILPALRDAGIAWRRDSRGFYYTRPEDPAQPAGPLAIFLHKLGTPAAEDRLVLSAAHLPGQAVTPTPATPAPAALSPAPGHAAPARPVPRLIIPAASDYALLTLAAPSQGLAVFTLPESQLILQPAPWQSVAGPADGVVAIAPSVSLVFLLTEAGAPNRRVVTEDLAEPGFANARTLIATSDSPITAIAAASDALFVARRSGSSGELLRLDFNASVPQPVPLPVSGVVAADGGLAADPRSPGAAFSVQGWTQSQAWLRYDFRRHRGVSLPFSAAPGADRYSSQEVSVPAADGAGVKLTLIMRQGTKRDGARPALLVTDGPDTAYGPRFVPQALAWADQGGVFAIAHPRGAAGAAPPWRAAGSGARRGVAYGDIAACAAWLQTALYTDPAHTAAWGAGSAAPSIAGAMLRAPTRFAAIALTGGTLNPLRAPGAATSAGFGNAALPAETPAVLAADPVAQLKDGTEYPAALIEPGTDAPAWQSAKFAARLQAASVSTKPVLLHAAGLTDADVMAFLLWQLNTPGFDLAASPPAPGKPGRVGKHRHA